MVQDKETAQLLHKARKFANLVANDNWKDAKDELVALLKQLDTISDIDVTKSADDIKFTVAVRHEIKQLMYNWIMGIETQAGYVEKSDQQRASLMQFSHVVRKD